MAERWAIPSAYREHFSAINFSARLPSCGSFLSVQSAPDRSARESPIRSESSGWVLGGDPVTIVVRRAEPSRVPNPSPTDRLHPAPSVSHATNPTCAFARSRAIVLERHDATWARDRSSRSRLSVCRPHGKPKTNGNRGLASISLVSFQRRSPILTSRPNSLP